MSKAFLDLDYFEFGYLYASIRDECWNKMPRSLWLKLKIASTKAYLNHTKFGKQAKRDLKDYEDQLKALNK